MPSSSAEPALVLVKVDPRLGVRWFFASVPMLVDAAAAAFERSQRFFAERHSSAQAGLALLAVALHRNIEWKPRGHDGDELQRAIGRMIDGVEMHPTLSAEAALLIAASVRRILTPKGPGRAMAVLRTQSAAAIELIYRENVRLLEAELCNA